jgi:UPF0716 protein FxsA
VAVSGRGLLPLSLVVAFVVVPLAEIYLIIQVGQAIGAWWTVALLLLDSLLGAWLVRAEGRRAWAALQQALRSGRMPSRELADAALILVGGTLLLTPGFLTDAVGFFLLLPFTRPLARRLLAWFARRRLLDRRTTVYRRAGPYGDSGWRDARRPARDRAVEGEDSRLDGGGPISGP